MRYSVLGPTWAGGRYVGPALTPPYVSEGQAGISYGPVTFHPGNQAVPVGHSNVDQGLVGLALTGRSRSSDAPDFFHPRFGYQVAAERADVHTKASITAPVPSTPPVRLNTVRQQFVPRVGGLSQIGQPQTIPRWPSVNRRRNG
jgi:hypothetical protein